MSRLFCFPHAGGGTWSIAPLKASLARVVEVEAVELPGRGRRHGQPCATRMEDLIAVLRPEIEQRARGEPFAFFGHSMGALLSYELTRALRSAGGPMPSRLFVAATSAPHARIVRPSLHTWPDAEMWQELTRFGGVPPTFLQDPELRAMMTPIIRADLELCHTYEWDDGAPLDVPISVFAGADDPHTSLASVREWRRHTTADFTVRVFAGGHFFIAAALTEVTATIAHDLSRAGERAHTGRLVR